MDIADELTKRGYLVARKGSLIEVDGVLYTEEAAQKEFNANSNSKEEGYGE